MFNFSKVTKKIETKKVEMAEYITNVQSMKYPNKLGPISDILKEERVKVIGLYEEILLEDLDTALNKITKWGQTSGALCAELGMSISMALDEVNYYREEMSNMILEVTQKDGIDFQSYHQAQLILQKIIDQAAQSFSMAFVEHHNDMMKKARQEIEELSVPVVPLEKKVAVLPLIGTIDTYRAKLLMQESLEKSSKLGISYFILDLSGVPIVDTMVANQVFQVIDALKLLGIKAVISGIRPEIAQTMVALGINFKNIQTYSTLEQALQEYRRNEKNF
ncbi:STAS domain-containing protein [Neobacillus terrae]|uniref:STAS domain-containing protein n=1 Tax=Neobacillus terrae TaxID=3034837 RepID=UPI00140C26B9|nr:STAS domain-containing protein [Neobacillus terrae]NHM30947.1 STAS domain-containing protein [Neobacillus terrae]